MANDRLPSAEVLLEVFRRGGAEMGDLAKDIPAGMDLLSWTVGVAPVPESERPTDDTWVRFLGTEFDDVMLRLEDRGGRIVPTGMLLLDSEEIAARRLRALRIPELIAGLEQRQRGRRKGTEPENTARLYREALIHHPHKPVAWVAEQLGVDQSTVHRRLARAGEKQGDKKRRK